MAHPVWTPAIVPRATHRLQLANNLFHTYSTVLTHGATYAHGTVVPNVLPTTPTYWTDYNLFFPESVQILANQPAHILPFGIRVLKK